MKTDIEGFQYRWYLLPLNQLGGVHTVNQLAEDLRFETLKDYEDWLARLKALPVRIDQTIALMRLGIKERIIHPQDRLATSSGPDRSSNRQRSESESAL